MAPARSLLSFLKPRTSRGRVLLWATLIGLLFGTVQAGKPLENLLRDTRNILRMHKASGDITLVAIDERSIEALGRWPWPRAYHAQIADRLREMGARSVFFDIIFSSRSDTANDQKLAESLKRLGRSAVLPVVELPDPVSGTPIDTYPLPELRESATLGHIVFDHNVFGSVRRLPYALTIDGVRYPSFAALLARKTEASAPDFPIDYSVDPQSIPKVSAVDLLQGRAPRRLIAGHDVIIGTTATFLGDTYVAPGIGVVPGVYIHVLGAETLKERPPITYSWLAAFIPALIVAGLCVFLRRRLVTLIAIPTAIALLLVLPFPLESSLIFVDIMPAIFLLAVVGGSLGWTSLRQSYRIRGTVNPVSGLPNLLALYQEKISGNRILVAARMHNYAAIASTLPAEGERTLVGQIAARLTVGQPNSVIYHGDEGIFAWFVAPGPDGLLGAHLEALHTLFRTPVMVGDKQFDLVLTFGVDADYDRTLANRVSSALVAADDAFKDGVKWKQHDPAKLHDSAWRLSMLSQLDAAIDAGDLWVAYQPKLELGTGRIVGAEALARWTHPEKGPISPVEFILAAEQSDRIEKLTEYVLEQAIRSATIVNEQGLTFNISVNLSARLIDDPELVQRIATLLRKHRLDPDYLTLEVTETAALGSSARNLSTLQQLRDMGIHLSVDDYGTGMSTLEYLQRIPATEIKVDRSFVIGMRDDHATRVMVNSTIQLAHSLGQVVVAEGVEDEETLVELKRMQCDLAQGFLIGRPMTFRALTKRLFGERREAAA